VSKTFFLLLASLHVFVMGLDRSGRSSGEALVIVRSPEAALAVKRDKDNTFLGDRYVKIFVD